MFIRSALFGLRNRKGSDKDRELKFTEDPLDKQSLEKDALPTPVTNGHAPAVVCVDECPYVYPAFLEDPFETNGFTFGPLWQSFGWVGGIHGLGNLFEALELPIRRSHSHYDVQLQVVHSAFGFPEYSLAVDNDKVGKDLHVVTAKLTRSPEGISPGSNATSDAVPVEVLVAPADSEPSTSVSPTEQPGSAVVDRDIGGNVQPTLPNSRAGAPSKKTPTVAVAASNRRKEGAYMLPTAASSLKASKDTPTTTPNRKAPKDAPAAATNRKAPKDTPAAPDVKAPKKGATQGKPDVSVRGEPDGRNDTTKDSGPSKPTNSSSRNGTSGGTINRRNEVPVVQLEKQNKPSMVATAAGDEPALSGDSKSDPKAEISSQGEPANSAAQAYLAAPPRVNERTMERDCFSFALEIEYPRSVPTAPVHNTVLKPQAPAHVLPPSLPPPIIAPTAPPPAETTQQRIHQSNSAEFSNPPMGAGLSDGYEEHQQVTARSPTQTFRPPGIPPVPPRSPGPTADKNYRIAFETEEDDVFRELEGEDPLRVVGTSAVGSTLLGVVPKAWLPLLNRGQKCHFQWFRCPRDEPATKIDNAKFAKYQLRPEDINHRLQVVSAPVLADGSIGDVMTAISPWVLDVRGSNTTSRRRRGGSGGGSVVSNGYSPSLGRTGSMGSRRVGSVRSSGSTEVNSLAETTVGSSPVQILGEAMVGETLVVAAPSWDDHSGAALEPSKCKIQWLRGTKERSGHYSFNKIPGAKTPRYVVAYEDFNCRLRVVAAPILEGGSVGRAWTALTARITNPLSREPLASTGEY